MDLLIIACAKYLIVVPPIILVGYGVLARRHIQRKLVILGGISLPLAYGLSKLADALYYNARPFVVENSTPLIAHVADNGFPSNHMLLAAMMAALLFVYNRKLGIVVGVVAVCIGAARVLADVHHTLDIVASGLIAVGVVTGVYVSIRSTKLYQLPTQH